MNTRQVLELAREWVDHEASRMPGFIGAHLMGSINFVDPIAPFAAFKDVDMNLIFEGERKFEVHDIFFKGRILEYGSCSQAFYASAEVVLANPEIACNLSVNSILSDPAGNLAALQPEVARGYKRRKWVTARSEKGRQSILDGLVALEEASSPNEALMPMNQITSGMTGLLAEVSLVPPTHRRCLILIKRLLTKWGAPELHEDVLRLWGFVSFDREQVIEYMQACAEAFDRAVTVVRSPVPYAFKLHPFIRPYVVEGIQEMIDEGCHREAMYWAFAFLWITNNALQVDGTAEDRRKSGQVMTRLIEDMGLTTSEDVSSRYQQACSLNEQILTLSEQILKRNAEIED